MGLKTELSNMSYTNKDFNSIYVELLEYAKKLSYKWDPAASDESDPGVVLLKLAAIIGDKDCYNIDKNILELMPASVTQLAAARQLFEQCGYSMRYYRAAQGDVNITIKKDLGDDLDEYPNTEFTYTIPQFTMFTDQDSSTIYTSTSAKTIEVKTETSIPVIEGAIVQYTVNNDALITMQNLDNNNRLYFTESNIAENGIFITTVDSTKPNYTNYEDWKCVDNLEIQPKGTLCYRFGVTIDSSVCYIEFPQDIETILGEGLHIHYVLTNGSAGNISAGAIRNFYVDTKFTRTAVKTNVTSQVDATTENITIKNLLPILNGQDPESIDDAYKNYKRVRDTFNTLVSLKDYSDYLVTSQTASNGFVCDRTNDIQRSYKVLTTDGSRSYRKTIIEADGELLKGEEKIPNPSMNAFHLCAYAFEFVSPVNKSDELTRSFQIVDLTESDNYKYNNTIFKQTSDNDVESLQHDYLGFEQERILLLKNKYPVTVNIVPKYPLSTTEKFQVILNAEKAMCNALNSTQMTFGEAASAEIIQNAILNSDERIKTLIDFVSPKYQTYAVYKDKDNNFKELRIDQDSDDGGYYVDSTITNSTFKGGKGLYVKNLNQFRSCENETFDSSEVYYKYSPELSCLWQNFRTEIFAKNVLSGVTPLYNDDNTYTTSIFHSNTAEYKPVTKIETNVNVNLTADAKNNKILVSEKLKENENILLTCPNLVEETNYSSYVKLLYFFNGEGDIPDGAAKELTKGEKDEKDEFIIFFWKESDASADYTYVKYDSSSKSPAKFISPSGFLMKSQQDLTSSAFVNVNTDAVRAMFSGVSAGKGRTSNIINKSGESLVGGNKSITSATDFVAKCLNSNSNTQVLTGTQVIYTKNVKTIHLNNTDNGCQYFSWILNTKNTQDNTCKLFSKKNNSYTLKSGEYFLYTNDDKTTLYILGEGTIINREGFIGEDGWSVTAVDYDKILVEGIDYINWYKLARSEDRKLFATEQQQILIGPGNKLKLTYVGSEETPESEIKIDSISDYNLSDYTIVYIDDQDNEIGVPNMNSEEVHWSAKSILNLNMSKDHPQKIDSNQTIKLTVDTVDTVDAEPIPISGKTLPNGEYVPKYIQCSHTINTVGGTDIDLADLFGSKSSVGMFTYEIDNNSDTNNVHTNPLSNITIIDLSEEKNTIDLIVENVYPGEYLLQVLPSNDAVTGINIEVKDPDETYSITKLSGDNTYKLIVHVSSTIKFRINYSSSEKGTSLIIPALFKYNKKQLTEIITSNEGDFQGRTFESILLEKIKALDVEKSFDYTHRPSNPVTNPLVSTSFLRKDHYYNPYTICEWDADIDNSVTIHDVIR